MAIKRSPAPSPNACFTRSKKYCLKIFGSSVVPDLLDTKKSVLLKSILFSIALICAGSVESSTCSSGNPSILPKDLRITSGQRLDPPIPRSRACEKPPSAISSANLTKRSAVFCCSPTMLNQPSHLPSSPPVQSEASRAHNRLTLSAEPHSLTVALTASDKSRGNENLCGLIPADISIR